MAIPQQKIGLFPNKTRNPSSCRSALLQKKCGNSCSAILQNKCRSSKIYTNSSGAIDSRKSCHDGLSSISKPADRSSFAKSLLSNKIAKGSPTIKKRNPEKYLVDSIRKKPKVECKKAMAARLSEDLLGLLMSHEYASFFSSPVDPQKLGLPDYFKIVKYPMDLGTVKKKMESGVYFLDPLGFSSDVRMTFSNAMMYNPPTDDLHIMAKTLCDFFQLRWKPIVKKLVVNHRAWDEDLSNNQSLGDGLLMSEKKTASEPGSY